jgi:hypothetical protein
VTERPHFRAFCEAGACQWSSESEDSYNDADTDGRNHLTAAHPHDEKATFTIDET